MYKDKGLSSHIEVVNPHPIFQRFTLLVLSYFIFLTLLLSNFKPAMCAQNVFNFIVHNKKNISFFAKDHEEFVKIQYKKFSCRHHKKFNMPVLFIPLYNHSLYFDNDLINANTYCKECISEISERSPPFLPPSL